ncbi:sensor histidine kinase [Fulvivirga lutea]|uniref:histidine kinase n=1 Tax=Fulvivirga lutea TaxID=2810512 RepID=A0A974WGJ9_9BACT|nr:HAMP domain-containing sensor histidine kinase [Fulvivirga lutea]QSE97474.1 HAMP domain-containing histidine kinase [Fulvivirga lutea]
MAVILSAIGILLIYFIISSHFLHKEKSKALVLQKLRAISLTASQFIDGDAHEYIVNTYHKKNDIISSEEDSIYLRLHRQLNKVKQLNALESPIYTMVFNQGHNEYEFIITSSEQPYYRHMFVNYPSQLRMNYSVGGVIDEYQTENGTWLSAFAPIKNSKGEVVAILQVDQEFDSFLQEAREDLIKNILFTSVLFVPFMIFLFTYMRNVLTKEEQNQQLLEERNEEIEIQNEMIKEANLKLEKANLIIQARNDTLDKQVKKRTKELLEANQDLETFLYRSSHDIQGPIASLKGVVNLAQADTNNGKEYYDFITTSVNQLETRIRGINSVFEIKKQELDLAQLSIREVFEDAVTDQCNELGFHRVDLKFGGNAIVKSDKTVLSVLFSELVKNSIMYRNSDIVKIDLSTELVGQKHIRITYKDNGVGIDADQRDSIFDMFKRGNEKSQGSGLGLYAVKLALEKLHGKITLLSADNGVTFQINLPR